MRKAFSLIELSIVFMVIGILAGMTVKGKALLETSRTKADMATVNKLASVVTAYAVDMGTEFDNITTSSLLQNNYVKKEELVLRSGGELTVIGIVPPATNGFFTSTQGRTANVAAVFPDTAKGKELGCIIDNGMDDGFDNSSNARAFGAAGQSALLTVKQCKSGLQTQQMAFWLVRQ